MVIASLAIAAAAVGQDVDKLKFPPLNDLVIPKVDKITLDNGIRLYLLEDHRLPVLNMSVRINCGSHLEPADKVGLASITGEVLRTGGTKKWTGDEIDAALEAVGASVETSIGLLSGNASVNCLSEYSDLGLEVLAEVLQRPVFDQDKLELAKIGARSVISRRNDDPQDIGQREFNKLIYGPTSVYARHEEYATINAITRDDLVKFHQSYFKPENIQMAVWGDFNKDELVEKLKSHFGAWQRGTTPVPPPPQVDYKYESNVYYINKDDVNQSNIYIGHIGGLVTDPDNPARTVMNNVLGLGFASRLFNNVRSKEGLAYGTFGVYSANIAYPGAFYAYAGTKSETTAKAIRVVMDQIKSMQTLPPTPLEMRFAKDGELNSFVFNFDTKAEVVNRLMNYDFYGLPEDFLQQQKTQIEKVTPNDVVAAAKNNLRTDALKILVVGKGKDFEMPLDQLGMGAVTTIDVTIPSGEEKKEIAVTPEAVKKGQELLVKAARAHGGLDKFKKVNSVSVKGTYTVVTPQGDFGLNFTRLTQFPDKSRNVVNFMGRDMYDISTAKGGWKTDQQTMQLVAKNEEDILSDNRERQRDLVEILKQADKPTFQTVYDGVGEVEGQSVDYVTLLTKGGDEICRLGINSNTGMIMTRSFWGETPLGPGQITEVHANHGAFGGIKFAQLVTVSKDGSKTATIELSEVVVNGQIPPGSFDKPQM